MGEANRAMDCGTTFISCIYSSLMQYFDSIKTLPWTESLYLRGNIWTCIYIFREISHSWICYKYGSYTNWANHSGHSPCCCLVTAVFTFGGRMCREEEGGQGPPGNKMASLPKLAVGLRSSTGRIAKALAPPLFARFSSRLSYKQRRAVDLANSTL